MNFRIDPRVMQHMVIVHLEKQARLDGHADAIKNGRKCDCWSCMNERIEQEAKKKQDEEASAK